MTETITRVKCGVQMLREEGKKPPRHWRACGSCASCRSQKAAEDAFWARYERTMST